jgi:hypothetical protein
MKKNVLGVFFVISMLMCVPVRADDAVVADTATTTEVSATTDDVSTTDDAGTTDDGDAKSDATTDDAAKGGFVSSLKGMVVWPWEKGKELTNDRPFASGVVLTTAAFVAMYKLCPWFREEVLGCTKKRKQADEDLF